MSSTKIEYACRLAVRSHAESLLSEFYRSGVGDGKQKEVPDRRVVDRGNRLEGDDRSLEALV